MRVLALSISAAAMAGAIAVAPMVVGADPPPDTTTFLNRVEGGGFDHNRAHIRASPAAVRRADVRLDLCDDEAWRGDNAWLCPAEPPTLAETASARLAGADLAPLGPTQPDGLWGPLLGIPSTAIHAIVLPTGKVLYVSQPKWPTEDEAVVGGNAHVWDPVTNTSRAVPPPDVPYPSGPDRPANLWCGGQTTLADGRVLLVGGNLEYPVNGGIGEGNGFKGGSWVMTFDPWTETWTRYADMPHGRWYPTLTELSDGRVLIVGGWDETGGEEGAGGPGDAPRMVNNQDVEVFDPATPPGGQATTVVSALPPDGPGQPTPYPDHRDIGLYPHMFLLPDTTALGHGADKVLVAGPGKYDSAVIDTGTWIWTDVLDRSVPDVGQPRLSTGRSWGTAWLEPSGPEGSTRVVLLGGANSDAPAPGPGTAPPPLGTAEVLDLDDPDSGWQPDPELDLNVPRAHFNTVLLPDGTIFSNGGGYGRRYDSLYADPVYRSELYTPGQGWREVGDEADARSYHSTSVLLPDGRVASAGDDRDIAPEHITLGGRTAQLWSPPYLFDGPRPQVTSVPQAVRYDAPFRLTVAGPPSDVTAGRAGAPGRGHPRGRHVAAGDHPRRDGRRGRPQHPQSPQRHGGSAGLLHALRPERGRRALGGVMGPSRPGGPHRRRAGARAGGHSRRRTRAGRRARHLARPAPPAPAGLRAPADGHAHPAHRSREPPPARQPAGPCPHHRAADRRRAHAEGARRRRAHGGPARGADRAAHGHRPARARRRAPQPAGHDRGPRRRGRRADREPDRRGPAPALTGAARRAGGPPVSPVRPTGGR